MILGKMSLSSFFLLFSIVSVIIVEAKTQPLNSASKFTGICFHAKQVAFHVPSLELLPENQSEIQVEIPVLRDTVKNEGYLNTVENPDIRLDSRLVLGTNSTSGKIFLTAKNQNTGEMFESLKVIMRNFSAIF